MNKTRATDSRPRDFPTKTQNPQIARAAAQKKLHCLVEMVEITIFFEDVKSPPLCPKVVEKYIN